MIGAKWFAAAGAIVVVIGVGLFVRLAVQQGWLNLISPWAKCVSGAAFGVGLLIAGEVIRRRISAIASAGVSAAGLGALFASAYAAYGIYPLLPPAAAFASLAAVAAIGFAVAARGRLVSIGVLSLVAGYINPLVIGPATSGPLVLPAYLFTLLCAALALSAWRAVPFRPLRGLAWWGTLIYGAWWCGDQGLNYPAAALTFLGGVWAAVHAELAVASLRPELGAPATALPAELLWNRARFIATSFSSTAWATVLAVGVIRDGARVGEWWPPAVIAVVALAIALRLAGNLRILRDVPKTDLERLGAGLAMQAGALVVAAVALAFTGWAEVVAWLALGVAAAGTGRWIRSRGLEVYGLVALVICSARLVTYDSPFLADQPWMIDLGGIVLTRWSVLMAAGSLAWALAAGLIRPADSGAWKALRAGAQVAAMAHLNLGLIHPDADASSVCIAWMVLGIAGLLLGRSRRALPLTVYGVVVMAAASLRLLAGAPHLGSSAGVIWEGAGLVVTRWTLLMLGGAAAWLLGAALVRLPFTSTASGEAGPLRSDRAAFAGIGLAMVYASLLHPSAEAASLCYAWLTLAVVVGVVHARVRTMGLDFFAAVGMAVAAGAWLVAYPIDWMDLSTIAPHPGLVGSALVAGCAIGMGAWLGGSRQRAGLTIPAVPAALMWGAVGLLFVSTSLEVARIAGVLSSEPTARRAAVSIWWGLVAVGLIVWGFRRVAPPARHIGLALMVIATGKAAIFDLALVPQVWRVASFIGLGLLMLGVAVGYARISARVGKPAARAEAGGG